MVRYCFRSTLYSSGRLLQVVSNRCTIVQLFLVELKDPL
jgi:hypothetical protein